MFADDVELRDITGRDISAEERERAEALFAGGDARASGTSAVIQVCIVIVLCSLTGLFQ